MVDEFKTGDMKKQKTILSALGHTHIMMDGVLRLQTEKPLHVWQEVVLQIDDEDKLLEPPNDIAIKGYSKKIWVLDTKLWKSLYQVRTSLIEMECANFLKVVEMW